MFRKGYLFHRILFITKCPLEKWILRHFISLRVSLRVLNGTRRIWRKSTPKRKIRRLVKRKIHVRYVYLLTSTFEFMTFSKTRPRFCEANRTFTHKEHTGPGLFNVKMKNAQHRTYLQCTLVCNDVQHKDIILIHKSASVSA